MRSGTTLPISERMTGPPGKGTISEANRKVRKELRPRCISFLREQIGRERARDAGNQHRRDGNDYEGDRRSAAEIVHGETFPPDLEGQQCRCRAWPASGHGVDEVVGREGG